MKSMGSLTTLTSLKGFTLNRRVLTKQTKNPARGIRCHTASTMCLLPSQSNEDFPSVKVSTPESLSGGKSSTLLGSIAQSKGRWV